MRRMKCAAHGQRTNAEGVQETWPLVTGTAAKFKTRSDYGSMEMHKVRDGYKRGKQAACRDMQQRRRFHTFATRKMRIYNNG